MIVTDEPMPDVQQVGDASLWIVVRQGGEIKVLTGMALEQFELARSTAFGVASSYDEVIVLDATILYRAWRKDHKKNK